MSKKYNIPWNYDLTSGIITINKVEVPYIWKVNLRELFTKSPRKFPNCSEENVIYCIHNDVNGKCYIGQARDLFDRFSNGIYSHLSSYSDGGEEVPILYRALNKYKASKFTVYILKELDSNSELNELEAYYIRLLHTCIYDSECWGYNMTWGGQDCSNLHTDEIRSKILKSIMDRYDGDPAGQLHTDEAINNAYINGHTREAELKRLETNRKNHGGILAYNTTESHLKSMKTRMEMYDGDCMGPCHTEESYAKSRQTKLELYGDLDAQLRWPESVRNQGISQSITKLLNSINQYIDVIKSSGMELSLKSYLDLPQVNRHSGIHFTRIWNKLDLILSDDRCTDEIFNLFSNMDQSILYDFISYWIFYNLDNTISDLTSKNLELNLTNYWNNLNLDLDNSIFHLNQILLNKSLLTSDSRWDDTYELILKDLTPTKLDQLKSNLND